MNRLILAIIIIALNACSAQQTKITEANYQAYVVAEAEAEIEAPATNRHKSPLRFPNRPSATDEWAANEAESLFPSISRYIKQGVASWYGPGFHGKKTATGEIFDMFALTAAHKTLPIPCYAQITNLENNRSIVVRINDRGPFVRNRELDLSYGAAKTLDMAQDGTGKIEIKTISDSQALPKLHELAEAQAQDVYLQVGSFGNVKKARQLKDKIASFDLPEPDIRSSTYRNSTLYKVQMGPINSPADATELNQQLVRIGITDTQFVTESKQSTNSRVTM